MCLLEFYLISFDSIADEILTYLNSKMTLISHSSPINQKKHIEYFYLAYQLHGVKQTKIVNLCKVRNRTLVIWRFYTDDAVYVSLRRQGHGCIFCRMWKGMATPLIGRRTWFAEKLLFFLLDVFFSKLCLNGEKDIKASCSFKLCFSFHFVFISLVNSLSIKNTSKRYDITCHVHKIVSLLNSWDEMV